MADHEKSIAALKDLLERRASRPEVPLMKLVDQVAQRHDLDAAQSEWLLRKALEPRPGEEPAACRECGAALEEAEGVAGHLRCPRGHLVARRPSGA